MNAIELYREFPETETREQQALMGVWHVGQLLKIQARRFFREYLSSEMQFNIMLLLKHAGSSDEPAGTQRETAGRQVQSDRRRRADGRRVC